MEYEKPASINTKSVIGLHVSDVSGGHVRRRSTNDDGFGLAGQHGRCGYIWLWLSPSLSSAILYVLTVLWIMCCFHIMGNMHKGQSLLSLIASLLLSCIPIIDFHSYSSAGEWPLLFALAFDNGLAGREAALKRLNGNNLATSYTNLVNFRPIISEVTLFKHAIFAAIRPQFDDDLHLSPWHFETDCKIAILISEGNRQSFLYIL